MQQISHTIMCGHPNHENTPAKFLCLKKVCSSFRNHCDVCFQNLKHPHLDEIEEIDELIELFSIDLFSGFEAKFLQLQQVFEQRRKKQQQNYKFDATWLLNMEPSLIRDLIEKSQIIKEMKHDSISMLNKLIYYFQEDENWLKIPLPTALDNENQQQDIQLANASPVQDLVGEEFKETLKQNDSQIAGIMDQQLSVTTESQISQPFSGGLQQILQQNAAWILVVDRPPSWQQLEDRFYGIVVLTEMFQGVYCLNLAPFQGRKNNFIMVRILNCQQVGWIVRETYRILEPISVKELFKAGSDDKNLKYDPQNNNSKHAQNRIINYITKLQHLKEGE